MTTGEQGFGKHIAGNRVTQDDFSSYEEWEDFEVRRSGLGVGVDAIGRMHDFMYPTEAELATREHSLDFTDSQLSIDALANGRKNHAEKYQEPPEEAGDTTE